MSAAILFEPDGYVLEGRQLMGRRAAGAAFLRAAVEGREGETLWGYTPHRNSAIVFRDVVKALDPAAQASWVPANRQDMLAERGLLYRPDSVIGLNARLRLRVGPGAYSICGVTHTLSSEGALDGFVGVMNAPVMPWDAIICTSTAAVGVAEAVFDAETEHQMWRSQGGYRPIRPRLPVIPLGVHARDFDFSDAERAAARARLGLGEDDVAAMFAGRLSFFGKAHPMQMYQGLQAVAKATGKPLVLIQAGQFFNEAIEQAIRRATADFAPDVRSIFVDGQDNGLYAAAYAGSDIFMSLSDNLQETFGLTPVEAMAAGLPVVVTDWNGYKDTVVDGEVGFRIPTWAPAAGVGEPMARDFETGGTNFNLYMSRTSTTVSVDMRVLEDRLTQLALNPGLRRKLGAAGRARARALYDWAVVYRQYKELWAELTEARVRMTAEPQMRAWLAGAPWAQAGRLDPFLNFAHYPTWTLDAATLAATTPGANAEEYQRLVATPALNMWTTQADAIGRIFEAMSEEPRPVCDVADACRIDTRTVVEVISRLAKMGLVRLVPPQQP